MLLVDLLARYARERPDIEPKSVKIVLFTLNNFRRFLCHEPLLADLTKDKLLDLMLANAAAKLAVRTVNHHRGNLILLWNFAAEKNLLQQPPKIAKRREPRREPVVWTLAEFSAIYAATDLLEGFYLLGGSVSKALSWKIALAIAWDTATRIDTIKQALLTDVNLATGVWIARAETIKGKRGDEVKRLHADTLTLLKRSLDEPEQQFLPSFEPPRKRLWPYPYRLETAQKHLKKLLVMAGLPCDRRHKFHCIRRTSESYAANLMGVEWAARAVGHSPEVAVKHYISSVICRPPALIDALPRPFH